MKVISIALMSLLFAVSAAAQTAPVQPQIIVTADGVIKATPDQAWISIGAETRSKNSKDAQQRNAEAMTAVIRKIESFGIPKEAIRTTAIDLQLEFDYANGRQTPRGYVARNTVEVRVDDLAKVGDVLDAVVASGATTIHGLRFDVKQREQLEASALQAAVKSASFKAQAIATGSNRTIDRILQIEELTANNPRPMTRDAFMVARAEAQTPVAPGELEIRAQVRLIVAIK
jgi:uncharacterized protein YggE